MNVVQAVLDYLGTDRKAKLVQMMTAGRIYQVDLPSSIDAIMPIQTVLLRASGGAATRSKTQFVQNRIDVISYGQNHYESDALNNAVFEAMFKLDRHCYENFVLHGAETSGGPLQDRDMVTDWATTLSVFTVNAAFRITEMSDKMEEDEDQEMGGA